MPDVLKMRMGTFRPSRARPQPEMPDLPLVPGECVDATPHARRIWDEVVAYAPKGLLHACDAPLLRLYACALGRAAQAMELLMAKGDLDPSNPESKLLLKIWEQQIEIARKLSATLALTSFKSRMLGF